MAASWRIGVGAACAAFALAAASLPGMVSAPSAAGSVPTFVWTGKAATGASHNPNWSDGKNWKGKVAPAAPGPVRLAFPSPTCAATTVDCGDSMNDIGGLTVSKLSIKVVAATSPLPGLNVSGDSIRLDSLSEKTTVPSGTSYSSLPLIGLPITLGAAQTWKFNGGQVLFSGAITGTSDLTVSVANDGSSDFEANDSVGPVTVKGKNSSDGGSLSLSNGLFFVPTGDSLNVGGHTITAVDSGVYIPGGRIGPLVSDGAGDYFGNSFAPYGTFTVDSASLDSASFADFYSLTPGTSTPPAPVAGTDYPQLVSNGSVSLGSAQLAVSADCNQPLGTVYTLIEAAGGISGTFSGVANGTIMQASPAGDASCQVGGAEPPYLRFEYQDQAGTFTATVVAPPPSGGPRDALRKAPEAPTSKGGVLVTP